MVIQAVVHYTLQQFGDTGQEGDWSVIRRVVLVAFIFVHWNDSG